MWFFLPVLLLACTALESAAKHRRVQRSKRITLLVCTFDRNVLGRIDHMLRSAACASRITVRITLYTNKVLPVHCTDARVSVRLLHRSKFHSASATQARQLRNVSGGDIVLAIDDAVTLLVPEWDIRLEELIAQTPLLSFVPHASDDGRFARFPYRAGTRVRFRRFKVHEAQPIPIIQRIESCVAFPAAAALNAVPMTSTKPFALTTKKMSSVPCAGAEPGAGAHTETNKYARLGIVKPSVLECVTKYGTTNAVQLRLRSDTES